MSVSMPLWAYILLIGYSLVFSGLFAITLAAREREKRDHETLRQRMRAERDHWFRIYTKILKEKHNDSNKL